MSKYGTVDTGSPLHAAVISVENLARSVAFYEEQLGLDAVDRRHMVGRAFENHWGLAQGAEAEMVVLADRDCPVGRLVLLEFHAAGRKRIRNVEGQCFYGLVNLNFYTADLYAHVPRLEAARCRTWSAPVLHDMGLMIGTPVEIMMDGPDGVILNMIELRAPNPEARIHNNIAYIQENGGYNRCGSTAVATSQHCVRDYDRARFGWVGNKNTTLI